MLHRCYALGVASVDGTGFSRTDRQRAGLARFLDDTRTELFVTLG